MNDNYLWDRTGEPDREIQQLEEVLGELRYQPRSLQVPRTFNTRRRSFVPALAIAATVLVAVTIGLWLNLNRRPNQSPVRQAAGSQSEPASTTPKSSAAENQVVSAHETQKPKQSERRQLTARSFSNMKRPRAAVEPALTAEELAQKEQVVMALRMVSAKLNLAQRKTVGVPQTNIIRNQHKVG